MRVLLSLLLCGFINLSLAAQEIFEELDFTTPVIKFFETEMDFGESMEGEMLEHTFKFTNEGKEPIVISSILTSCGCTVVDWSADPIRPGKKGVIKARFNTQNRIGLQNKTLTVLVNSSGYQQEIVLKTNVIPRSQAKVTQ